MAGDQVGALHQDWAPVFDEATGRWRVARNDADGARVFGGATGLAGDPYACCCQDRAAALADAMNREGHA